MSVERGLESDCPLVSVGCLGAGVAALIITIKIFSMSLSQACIHNTLSLIDTSQGPVNVWSTSPSQPATAHCIRNRKEDRKKLIAEVRVLDEYG